MKLKLPSKARAGTVTLSGTIHTRPGDDDDVSITVMITGHIDDREGDRGRERESLPSIHGATDLPSFILPGPKCKVSASLSPHKSLLCWTERGRGRRLLQPTSADERVFIDQQGEMGGREEDAGCVSVQEYTYDGKYVSRCLQVHLYRLEI